MCALLPNQNRENHSSNAATSLRIEQPVPINRTLTDILKSGVTVVEHNGSSRADNSHEHRQQQFHPDDDAVHGVRLLVPPPPHQAVIHDVNSVLQRAREGSTNALDLKSGLLADKRIFSIVIQLLPRRRDHQRRQKPSNAGQFKVLLPSSGLVYGRRELKSIHEHEQQHNKLCASYICGSGPKPAILAEFQCENRGDR